MGYKWRVYKVFIWDQKHELKHVLCILSSLLLLLPSRSCIWAFFLLLSFFINLKPAVSDLQLSLFLTQQGGRCSGRPFSLSAPACQPCKLRSKGCSRAGNAEGRKTFSRGALQSACTKSPWQGVHGSACTREQPEAELWAQILSCTPVLFEH